MKFEKMSLHDGYHHVLQRRPFIKPNDGFIKQLIQFEKILYNVEKPSLNWKWGVEMDTVAIELQKRKKEQQSRMIELCTNYANSILTDDVLMKQVEKSVKVFNKLYTGQFIKYMMKEFQWNQKEIDEKGLELNIIKKAAAKIISKFYTSRIN